LKREKGRKEGKRGMKGREDEEFKPKVGIEGKCQRVAA
jgi:hypothetical protein